MTTDCHGRQVDRIPAPILAGLAALVHSNLLIATAATSVAFVTMTLAGLPVDFLALFIVFAATMFVYGLDRVLDLGTDARNVPGRAVFLRAYGTHWLAIGVVLYLAAVAVAVLRGVPGAGFLVLPLAVAVVYSLGRVKRLLLVKNLLVGGAWGAIPLGVGVYFGVLWHAEILVLAAFFTAMLTIAAAVFDIKDIEGDSRLGVRTLPTAFGPAFTRRVAAAGTLVVGIGVVAAGVVLSGDLLVLLAMVGYVLAYIPFATTDRGSLFYGLVVDGEHVFLAVVVILVGL